jgi:hypothetical protein
MTTQAITSSGAWYRERWPWLLAAGPAVVVVAALFTAWLAMSSDDGLVADDYYKRGLAINKVLEREARGEALNIGAVVSIGPSGSVRVALTSDADAAPATLRLRLAHPTRAGADAAVALELAADGAYVGRLAAPAAGRRLVTLETDTWRLPSVESIAPGDTRLGAERIAR